MAALSLLLTSVKTIVIAFTIVSNLNGLLFVRGQTILSDKRLCADKECETVISKAKALASHQGDHPQLLSFKPNDIIEVKSKSAGSNLRLWGGEVNGHRGYFDKIFVREVQILVSKPQFFVDTEGDAFSQNNQNLPPQNEDRINPQEEVKGAEDENADKQHKPVDENTEAVKVDAKDEEHQASGTVETDGVEEKGEEVDEIDEEEDEGEEEEDPELNKFIKSRLSNEQKDNGKSQDATPESSANKMPTEHQEQPSDGSSPSVKDELPSQLEILGEPLTNEEKKSQNPENPGNVSELLGKSSHPDSTSQVMAGEKESFNAPSAQESASQPVEVENVDGSKKVAQEKVEKDTAVDDIPIVDPNSEMPSMDLELKKEAVESKAGDTAQQVKQSLGDAKESSKSKILVEKEKEFKEPEPQLSTEKNEAKGVDQVTANKEELLKDSKALSSNEEKLQKETAKESVPALSEKEELPTSKPPAPAEKEKLQEPTLEKEEPHQESTPVPPETKESHQESLSVPPEKKELQQEPTNVPPEKKELQQEPTNVPPEKKELQQEPTNVPPEKEESQQEPTNVPPEKEESQQEPTPVSSGEEEIQKSTSAAKDEVASEQVSGSPEKKDLPKRTFSNLPEEAEPPQASSHLPHEEAKVTNREEEKNVESHTLSNSDLTQPTEKDSKPENKDNTLHVEIENKEVAGGKEVPYVQQELPNVQHMEANKEQMETVSMSDVKPDTASNIEHGEDTNSKAIDQPEVVKMEPYDVEDKLVNPRDENVLHDTSNPSPTSPELQANLNSELPLAFSSSDQYQEPGNGIDEPAEAQNKNSTPEQPYNEKQAEEKGTVDAAPEQQVPADGGLSDLLHGSDSHEARIPEKEEQVADQKPSSNEESTGSSEAQQNQITKEHQKVKQTEQMAGETENAANMVGGAQTIVEAGTTLVLDEIGNLMTIIPPDEPHTPSTFSADLQTKTPKNLDESEISQTSQIQPSATLMDSELVTSDQGEKATANVNLQASASETNSNTMLAEEAVKSEVTEDVVTTPQLNVAEIEAEIKAIEVEQVSQPITSTTTDSFLTQSTTLVANAPSTSSILLHSSVQEALSSSVSGNNTANLDSVIAGDSVASMDIVVDKDLTPSQGAYESADFNSRKVLSVGSSDQQEPQEKREEHAGQLPNSESGSQGREDGTSADVEPTKITDEVASSTPPVVDGDLSEAAQDENIIATSTPNPADQGELPPPPTEREDPEGSEVMAFGDYESEPVHQTRKINDEELFQKEVEEMDKKYPGFVKTVLLSLEEQAKAVIEKLPPSIQSVLEQEPLGLSPTMTILASSAMLATLVMITLTSCCCSGGSKDKKRLKASVGVIQELEAKLLLATKERENIEDMIQNNKSESKYLKEEMTKYTKEAAKLQTELQTVKLHNETLKNQVLSLQEELDEVRNNANTSQGEVKQQSKKTKDLERQIKKLDESKTHWEQQSHKLAADLKSKNEEVENMSAQISGFLEQIGHLQTSKDQLLQEAEDWKEKLAYSNERLEQRDEEFKQMQESLLFKENELEVLKDCFLQLKSFEDNGTNEDEVDNSNTQVQEKLRSMMDVSKVNGSLRALEEEKKSLENKLAIEREGRKELEEQLASTQRSMETSMADKMKAERQCQEAQTKLSVLSSYFKEKEMQLQRELGEQEALKKQNQSKLMSADETTQSMQQELELAKAHSESLKRELASSERDFRTQIAANEKKAHENWLAARAAERELKESRHEAGVLRQKLADIERRQFIGPGGLIRPLPTRGLPPPGMINGPPPPPGLDSPHLRDEEYLASPRSDRGSDRGAPPLPPFDLRRGPGPLPPGMRPPLPHGVRPPPPDARSPPPHFDDARSPAPRMPPPGMLDGRSPPPMPPFDRRPPPHHMIDRRSPPFRMPPPDMLPPSHPLRGGPMPPPPHLIGRGGSVSPPSGPESPRMDPRPDGRYPPYGRHPGPPSDRPSPRQSTQPSPRQQQSQV